MLHKLYFSLYAADPQVSIACHSRPLLLISMLSSLRGDVSSAGTASTQPRIECLFSDVSGFTWCSSQLYSTPYVSLPLELVLK